MTKPEDTKSDLQVLQETFHPTAQNYQKLFNSLKDEKQEEKVCLMQRDQIGNFYFSNPLDTSTVADLELKREISKIKIIPTTSLKRSTSTLASKPKQSVKKLKTGVQQRPVEFKDYGVFTSFAPRYDSGMASLAPGDSTLVLEPFRKAKVEILDMVALIPTFDACPVISKPPSDWKKLDIDFDDYSQSKPVDNESLVKAFNQSPLAKDIQLEKILSLPQKLQEARHSKTPQMVDLLLDENKQLLQILQLHHQQRLLSKDITLITPQERKTAQMIINNLQALIQWVKPGIFKKGMDVEDFIFKVQDGREAVFRGTLGPGSTKAIHSNQVGPKSFP